MRYSGSTKEYLAFVFTVMNHPEQIYGDVNLTLVESLLRVEPLHTCFQTELEQQQIELVKACALTYASYGGLQFEAVRRPASRLLRNPLSEIVRMVEKIKGYPDVPGRLKARIEISSDAITGKPFVDMRSFLTARLLALNSKRLRFKLGYVQKRRPSSTARFRRSTNVW